MNEPFDLEGWKAIAPLLKVTPKTALAWMRAAGKGSPVKWHRGRVRAKAAEVLAWFESVHQTPA